MEKGNINSSENQNVANELVSSPNRPCLPLPGFHLQIYMIQFINSIITLLFICQLMTIVILLKSSDQIYITFLSFMVVKWFEN